MTFDISTKARVNAKGYIQISVLEHVLIAENAIGKPLPAGSLVHHVNGIKIDNRNENLVICENRAYHALLHARQRVIEEGGDPNSEKICSNCKTLRPTLEFYKNHSNPDGLHNRCNKCAQISWRQRIINAGGNPRRDKICNRCHLLLRRSRFDKNALKYDGLKGRCKSCGHAEYLIKRRANIEYARNRRRLRKAQR